MKRIMSNTVIGIVLSLLAVYSALVGLLYVFQERLIYFPVADYAWTPADEGWSYEDIWLTTADGVRIHGWFVPVANARGTVLYFHGNASNISGLSWETAALQQLGFNAFLIDYRGYGQSEGHPNEQGTYADAEAAWRYLTEERGLAPESIVVMGHSLGGGVAAWVAQHYRPAGLVLMSTFTSLPDVGAQHYPVLPVQWLSRNRYPTLERLAAIEAPLLILHSPTDTVVPYSHSERLAAAAPEDTIFLTIPDGHNGGLLTALETHPATMRQFFAQVVESAARPQHDQ